jgi:ubiquinone/menaquinone biosynthesis C-methylase UbiE
MNVRDAYTSWATTYDTDTNPTRDLDQEATRATLGQLRVARVLELGCGTGKNTALLAGVGAHVQALDFSEGMLERAQARVQASNVTFTVADLTRPWPCADHWAELIVGNLVLEHIADLGFIFAEAHRCIALGGQFFLCELHPARQYQGLQAHFTRDEGEVVIPAFVHHISDYLGAAEANGFALRQLREWWPTPDRTRTPLLVSLLFGA